MPILPPKRFLAGIALLLLIALIRVAATHHVFATVVDEPALVQALQERRIAGAAVDCVLEEPLPESSPLWTLDNLVITPHSAGETRRYEDNVIDLLLENLARQWAGEQALKNGII